jgi:hypothetical protein
MSKINKVIVSGTIPVSVEPKVEKEEESPEEKESTLSIMNGYLKNQRG